MPKATRRDASSRTEARRRSRQLDRGWELGEEAEAGEAATDQGSAPPRRPGLLSTLFPPAPPLPNRPDPLAGFTYSGPLRAQVAWLYLLARNPGAWLAAAIPWAAAQTMTIVTPFALPRLVYSVVGVAASLLAGWIGWQKPWLFGVAAAISGTIIEGVFLALVPGNLAQGTAAQWFAYAIAINFAQLSWLYAALMAWYAGYFRRRLAAQRATPTRQRRR
jgi:hypothetical protein